jgi:1-deoxy-D-xylulose-5-phosphate synthase
VDLDIDLKEIPIGSAEILRRGPDAAILATGASVSAAISAADLLAERGLYVTIVNVRYIHPIDQELILGLSKNIKHFITVEENVLSGGLGSQIAMLLKGPIANDLAIKSLGIPDEFVTHGTQAKLRAIYHLDAEGISSETMAFINSFKEAAVLAASIN